MSAEEKRLRQERAARRGVIKKWTWGVLFVGLIAGLFALGRLGAETDGTLVSARGVHWHAELNIVVDGERVPVPSGIGLVPGMEHPRNMHTHEEDNVIHVEIPGRVTEEHLRLKNFFSVWEQPFSRDNLLGNVISAESGRSISMKVNGIPNTDFENYILHDGDVVEISYGTSTSDVSNVAEGIVLEGESIIKEGEESR